MAVAAVLLASVAVTVPPGLSAHAGKAGGATAAAAEKKGGGGGNGNGGFDPDLYETPPQAEPNTQAPVGAAAAPGE